MLDHSRTPTDVPSYDIDYYSDEVIRDTFPHFRRMLDLGPVVWLPRHGNYALVGYDAVVAALRDNDTFISGLGVAADAEGCALTRGNTLASDGEKHDRMRRAVTKPLLPGALEEVRPLIESLAEGLIERMLEKRDFDAIGDLATYLPLTVVRDLVGLPDFGKDNMLRWAAAVFDILGVQNKRGQAAVEVFKEQRAYIAEHASRDKLRPGSWTHRIWEMADSGELPVDLARMCVRDYVNPSLDTTISATGELIWQLAKNPEAYQHLRRQPELIPNAVNEAVRLGSPARCFSRHTAREVEIAGVTLPAGARVMVLYGAANRDPAAFKDPERFDIARTGIRHVGFGSGGHMCAGMHLAQLEMRSILKALLPRVKSIGVGEGTIALNNTIHAYKTLPCRFEAETAPQPVAAPAAPAAPVAVRPGLVELEVRAVTPVADDVVALALADPDGGPLPTWEAGAHVDLHLGAGLVRQYSMTGPMRSDRYVVAVQKETASRGGSVAVHALRPGDRVTLGAPRNMFHLREDGRKAVLFSGGIGMTPILAMAWRLHALDQPFEWHVSARDYARLPFAADLDGLPFRDRIRLHIDSGHASQRLDAAQAIREAQAANLYCCGPTGYMTHVTAAARLVDMADDHIHIEHFSAEIDTGGGAFTVIAQASGKTVEVAEGQTILDALEDAGIHIDNACRTGICGSCLTRVLEGRIDHRDMVLTDAEKTAGDRMAVCCSRATTKRIVLDL